MMEIGKYKNTKKSIACDALPTPRGRFQQQRVPSDSMDKENNSQSYGLRSGMRLHVQLQTACPYEYRSLLVTSTRSTH